MASPPPTPAAAAAPRPDEATSPLVALDVTPEAKARLLRTLLSRTDDVYAVLELSGTCIYISPSVERLLGWRPEEMIGASCACTRCAALRLAAAAAARVKRCCDPRPFSQPAFRQLTRAVRARHARSRHLAA
jgi:hypothetical protein